MTFSQMVEEIIASVESLLVEASTGAEVSVLEQELLTYQYVTGLPNPFNGYELLRVEQVGSEKYFIYRKHVLLE